MQVIGRNIFALALSRITSGVILFVVQAKLADYLGPHDFGKYSLVIAFYVIFSLFVDFGMSRYVIKKVSEDKSAIHTYHGNFLIAQFFLAAVLFLLFIFIPRFAGYGQDVGRAMIYAGSGLLFAAMSIPAVTIIHAWQKIHLFAAVIFLESLAKAGWFAFAIASGADLVFVFKIYLYVGILDVLIYYLIIRNITRPKFTVDRLVMKSMFLFGLPFAMISGFEMLVAKIDTVLLKIFLPYSQVGLYSAAYRFLDFLTFLPAIVALSLFPYFSEKQDLRDTESAELINQITRYLVMLALPLGIGVTILADKIILPLFGPAYEGSVLPFQILIWSTVITLLYAVPNVIMQVKMTRNSIFILAGATMFNVIANWIFIPQYGIIASAYITVLSYILVAALYIYYSRRLAEFIFWSYASWPAIASAVMGAVLWLGRDWNILVLALLAPVIYFGFLLAVGYLNKKDWEFIRSIRPAS